MHTPAPWEINAERSDAHRKFIGVGETAQERNGGYWIAQVLGPDCAVNAKVIAAAPGAIAELVRVTDLLDTWAAAHPQDRTAEVDAAISCARAVIAKAIG